MIGMEKMRRVGIRRVKVGKLFRDCRHLGLRKFQRRRVPECHAALKQRVQSLRLHGFYVLDRPRICPEATPLLLGHRIPLDWLLVSLIVSREVHSLLDGCLLARIG